MKREYRIFKTEYRISNANAKEQGFEKFDETTHRSTKLTSSNFSNPCSIFDIRYSILFLFLFIFLLTSCENDLEEIKSVATSDELKYETMKNVELLYSDSAILRVKVMGDKMLRFLDVNTPKQEFPEGIKVDFFDQRGRTQSELTARYALRFEKKNEIIVRDSVVWESKKNEKLETEELIWDEKINKVYTKKFVKITRPGEIVYGYGFEANQDFTRWEINAITGRIKVDGLTEEFDE
jgi:LPS export ABC transporter protein LptC